MYLPCTRCVPGQSSMGGPCVSRPPPSHARDLRKRQNRWRMKSPGGSRSGRECPEPAGGDSKTHVAAVPLTFDLAVPPAGTGPAEVT